MIRTNASPRRTTISRRVAPLVGLVVAASLTPSASAGQPGALPVWEPVTQPAGDVFRTVTAVSRREAWVAGDDGEVWRTRDGGVSWQDVAPPDSELVGFRRIVLMGHGRVLLFARGTVDDLDNPEGPTRAAQIWLSSDDGRHWRLSWINDDPDAFFDAMAMFADGRHGLAVGDFEDGHFPMLATADGGRTWHRKARSATPRSIGREAVIASGRSMQTSGAREVWFGTNNTASRVLHSVDGGPTWTATDSTIPPDGVDDALGGVWGLAVEGRRHLVAVGGTFTDLGRGTDGSAYTADGRAWTPGGDLGGARYMVDWVPGRPGTAVAGGFTGTDVTRDGGRTWTTFSDQPYEAVDCAPGGVCWGAGEGGIVARVFLR